MNGALRKLNLDDVIGAAERLYELDPGSIIAHRRQKHIVDARRLVMFVARAWLELTYDRIGDVMNRDHSTVIYNVEELQRLIKRDRSRLQDIRELVAAAMIKAEVGRLSQTVFAQRMRLFLQGDEIVRRPVAAVSEAHQ